MMGLQFGLLARLTWWEYSWDIMEPVTYFVGYGSAIAMFAYYILTRQVSSKFFFEGVVPCFFQQIYLCLVYSTSGA